MLRNIQLAELLIGAITLFPNYGMPPIVDGFQYRHKGVAKRSKLVYDFHRRLFSIYGS
jgi:hypothetical protein